MPFQRSIQISLNSKGHKTKYRKKDQMHLMLISGQKNHLYCCVSICGERKIPHSASYNYLHGKNVKTIANGNLAAVLHPSEHYLYDIRTTGQGCNSAAYSSPVSVEKLNHSPLLRNSSFLPRFGRKEHSFELRKAII
jgi:hypothetical protein